MSDLNGYAPGDRRLKPHFFNCDVITADGQLRRGVAAVIAGAHRADETSVRILHHYSRAGHRKARRIRHRAENRASECLAVCCHRERQNN